MLVHRHLVGPGGIGHPPFGDSEPVTGEVQAVEAPRQLGLHVCEAGVRPPLGVHHAGDEGEVGGRARDTRHIEDVIRVVDVEEHHVERLPCLPEARVGRGGAAGAGEGGQGQPPQQGQSTATPA